MEAVKSTLEEELVNEIIDAICYGTTCGRCKMLGLCSINVDNLELFDHYSKDKETRIWMIEQLIIGSKYDQYKHLFRTGVTFK